jgi:hypothetical protein
MEHRSTFTILRERPEVRKQAGIAMGALLAAFGLHTWSITALMAGGVSGMSAADAGLNGFYSGVLSATVFLVAALVVGWTCGGWILESAADGTDSFAALRPALRKLAVVGLLLLVGVALGGWPLLGGLIMVAGAGAGSIARTRLECRSPQ